MQVDVFKTPVKLDGQNIIDCSEDAEMSDSDGSAEFLKDVITFPEVAVKEEKGFAELLLLKTETRACEVKTEQMHADDVVIASPVVAPSKPQACCCLDDDVLTAQGTNCVWQ